MSKSKKILQGETIISLNDATLDEQQVEYYYGLFDDTMDEDNQQNYKKIKTERLHNVLYREYYNPPTEFLNMLSMNFNRYMFSLPLGKTSYLNRYPEKKVKYNDLGFPIPTLPVSISTPVIIEGIIILRYLCSQFGMFFPLWIEYRKKYEKVVFTRAGTFNEKAIYLLYSFLKNNRLKILETDISSIDFETFYSLFIRKRSEVLDELNGRGKLDEMKLSQRKKI